MRTHIIAPNLIKLTHSLQWYPFKTESSEDEWEEEKKNNKQKIQCHPNTEHQKMSPKSAPLHLPLHLPSLPKWKTTAVFDCRGNNLASVKTYEFRHYFMNIIFSEERFICHTENGCCCCCCCCGCCSSYSSCLFLMFFPQQGRVLTLAVKIFLEALRFDFIIIIYCTFGWSFSFYFHLFVVVVATATAYCCHSWYECYHGTVNKAMENFGVVCLFVCINSNNKIWWKTASQSQKYNI